MIDFRSALNAEQYAAVTHQGSPALILAGAGSGKTRTLTYRVAWLLEQGVEPENILLLTFTNKAANEMLERVRELIPRLSRQILGGTFHSFGNFLLRQQPELFGLSSGFTILDRDDQEKLIASVCSRSKHANQPNFPKPPAIADLFSFAANTGLKISELIQKKYQKLRNYETALSALQKEYEASKLENNSVDFDDLLTKPLKLLQENPAFAAKYQNRFRHILVDEYQDTNRVQAQLVAELSRIHRGLMAVGDDAQSIYSWRGAEYRNILEFECQYPDAKIFKIQTNYRSVPTVLLVANASIEGSSNRYQKHLIPVRRGACFKPHLVVLDTPALQAAYIAKKIKEFIDKGVCCSEIGVLYRAHFLSQDLQIELQQAGIPYRITSGVRFFEQAHIKDLIAWMRFVTNPREETSFLRIASMLNGVGPKTANVLWQKTRQLLNGSDDFSKLKMIDDVPKKAKEQWEKTTDTFIQIRDTAKKGSPAEIVKILLDSWYLEYLESTYSNFNHRIEELNLLADYAEGFSSLESFLGQLALQSNVDGATDQDEHRPKVTLSSIHQAKGLEWKVVFIIWLVDGMFPSRHSLENPESLEEERRLFYVAITRCKDFLFLTLPQYNAEGWSYPKSQFLDSIPDKYLQIERFSYRNFN